MARGGEGKRVTAHGGGVSVGDGENALRLGRGDGRTTLNVMKPLTCVHFKRMDFMLCKLHLDKAVFLFKKENPALCRCFGSRLFPWAWE